MRYDDDGVLTRITSPDDEPVTLEQAKAQCRSELTITDSDDWYTDAIRAARLKVEGDTGRQLLPGVYEAWLRAFPCTAIVPPIAPLIDVVSIMYLDTAGDLQTWASSNYVVLAPRGDRATLGRIEPVYQAVWPVTRDQVNAVRVRFRAGYADADTVPGDLRHAILLLIGHWDMNREAVLTTGYGLISKEIELGYQALIGNYKVYPMPVAA